MRVPWTSRLSKKSCAECGRSDGAKALVDTSAWIEFYHPKGSDQVKRALASFGGPPHRDLTAESPSTLR